jgi:hypothetical protein
MSDGPTEQSPAEDDLDRALRELTDGTAGEARFRELSAKERAKAAKGQSKQAQQRAKARARQARGPSDGWRGGYRYDLPARQLRKQGRAARRRRALRAIAWTAAIALLAGGGVLAYQHFANEHGGLAAAISSGSRLSPVMESGGTPTDPFAGTPADRWANGVAGIVMPVAKPVSPFSAAQVEAAYVTTRKLLIAANLNEATLLGDAPVAFADLLAPQDRAQFLAGLSTRGTSKSGQELSTRTWVTSFAPGSADLIGSVIKVHGSMGARAVHESGTIVLAINVNYIFAYPIEPPGQPSNWMRVLAHQHGSFDFAQWDDPGGPLEAWYQGIDGSAGGICGINDGYIHPDYPIGAVPGPTGPAINPYSPPANLPAGGPACGGQART